MPEQTPETFRNQLTQARERVDHVLDEILTTLPFAATDMGKAMHYGALLGGKRLRPFLVYATGEMFGVTAENLDAPAAAIECIHAYSLIHDDLPAMDDDTLRRGKPTCHVAFGEANAILAGDALQTQAFAILAARPMPDVRPQDRLAMIADLADAAGRGGMCGGQALDLAAEGKNIGIHALEQIHNHKTGALIRASVRMGAMSAGEAGYAVLPALDTYAQAIGLAFQVQDDILDVIGHTDVIGKSQGSDAAHGKSTYPSLLGLKAAQDKAQALYQESLAALSQLEEHHYNTATLRELANFVIERNS